MSKLVDSGLITGAHNNDFHESAKRILAGNQFKDLSTVWVTPAKDSHLDAQVVFQSWLSIAMPMNQKVQRLSITNAEVGQAYNATVEMILRDSIKWKYMLTLETDNLPPRDGLLKLYESIGDYDAVGGLYWMKGPLGSAHIYGDPLKPEDGFLPQVPLDDQVQPCLGLGMGFTLFSVDMFRQMEGPWFETVQDTTQDLYFFKKAAAKGFKFAVDTRVKVGHMDFSDRRVW